MTCVGDDPASEAGRHLALDRGMALGVTLLAAPALKASTQPDQRDPLGAARDVLGARVVGAPPGSSTQAAVSRPAVDETSIRRHRYVTVVQNAETGEVLGVVKHRDFRALSSSFVSQGRRWCARVAVVVSDGSRSYRAAIERHVGHATRVIDHFHVARWFA